MRRHPVILGICLLLFHRDGFLCLIYGLSVFRGRADRSASVAKVGVVRIEGMIGDTAEIIDQISEFADDDGIRAVVLRIDSPGGGVASSQEIYQAVRQLRNKKKVVVSMGSIAASGGYLIATAADRIMANPGTITGSISAVMHFANVEELMKKVGVRSSVVKSGKFKDIGSPTREMTPEERELIQAIVNDIYDQFVTDHFRKPKNSPGEGRKTSRRKNIFRETGTRFGIWSMSWADFRMPFFLPAS